jgi:superfamily II DNA or RNA helicase
MTETPRSLREYIQTIGRSQRKDLSKNAKGGLLLDISDLTDNGNQIYSNLRGQYLVELQDKKNKRRAAAKAKREAEAANQVLNLEDGPQVDAKID